MNVTCTGCPAKYSVPDEKVRGKKVRITCKHCGTNIVVDGHALGASVAPQVGPSASPPQVVSAVPAAEPVAAPTTVPAATESVWLVGFIDERQEQYATSAIVEAYASGKIDEETLVWKDGMADWLPPFDVPELAAAMKARGVPRRAPSFALPSASDDEKTVVASSPFHDGSLTPNAGGTEPELPAAAQSPVIPLVAQTRPSAPEVDLASAPAAAAPKPAAEKPAAARRADSRAGSVDLFGAVANAGSEADPSLDFGGHDEPAQKMTGARNESSVLFSLDALTKGEPKTAQRKAQDREKEKQATLALFGESAPDSLMNMGVAGGLAALAAPDFTKPVAPEPVAARPNDPIHVPQDAPGKKKGGAALVGALVAIAAVGGLAFVFLSKKPVPENSVNAPAATAETTGATPLSTAEATNAAVSAAPVTTESAAPSAQPVTSASAAPTASPSPTPTSAKPATTAAPTTTPTAAPTTTAVVNKPAEKPAETKPDVPSTAAATPAAGADFDKGAAIAALSAAAANAASCKKPDGPTGSGKASVTFAPSGRATNSTVTGAFAGTDVGGCVARVFRSAKIPPFSGDPVTVSKSFSIE